MPVDSEAKAYQKAKRTWETVRDCVAGEDQVKFRRQRYLPQPNPEDTSLENRKRYDSYLLRASFVGYTGRTLEQLVGQVFAKAPVVEGLPAAFESWLKDIDGAGVGFNQQARVSTGDVCQLSRGFLFVDYPQRVAGAEPPSQEDVEKKGIRPRCLFYPAEDVINWDVAQVGGKTVLSLVVLKEEYSEPDAADPFVKCRATQYRVLFLENGIYKWEVHRETKPNSGGFTVHSSGQPTQGNNEPWTEIPFQPIGALANTMCVERPGLLPLAWLNLSHYRSSADREENAYRNGQATPVVSGLTKAWLDEQLEGKIKLGAHGGLALPVGGDAKYMQAEASEIPAKNMEDKEKQMKALGARFTESQDVQRTATESKDQTNTETSILAMLAANVETAYRQAFLWMALYAAVELDPEKVKVTLNKDYARPRMSGEEVTALVSLRTEKLVTFSESREVLARGGFATLDLETAKRELEAEVDAESQRVIEETKALMDHKASQQEPPAQN